MVISNQPIQMLKKDGWILAPFWASILPQQFDQALLLKSLRLETRLSRPACNGLLCVASKDGLTLVISLFQFRMDVVIVSSDSLPGDLHTAPHILHFIRKIKVGCTRRTAICDSRAVIVKRAFNVKFQH